MQEQKKDFIKTVSDFYTYQGRHSLPWRQTKDPYRILVSEVMLQQTQVERVIPKYEAFLKIFPSFTVLANAALADVLIHWQGLGYNRRAKMLHECAKVVVREYQGKLPVDEAKLRALPGIGPYTARAVLAFAFDTALPLIETNIRTVYIHHFFKNETDITDADILSYMIETLDKENPRDWYYALMDYGSYLKRTVGNNITKSKHYTKQSVFTGSDRQIRGAIIRQLIKEQKLTRRKLLALLTFNELRIDAQLERLLKEGLVVKNRSCYSLPD